MEDMKDQFEIHIEKHELLPFSDRHESLMEETTSRARFWRYTPMALVFCLLLLALALMQLEPSDHCVRKLSSYCMLSNFPLLQGTLTTYAQHRHYLPSKIVHTFGPDSTTLVSPSIVGPSRMTSIKTGEIFFVVC